MYTTVSDVDFCIRVFGICVWIAIVIWLGKLFFQDAHDDEEHLDEIAMVNSGQQSSRVYMSNVRQQLDEGVEV